MSRLSRRARPLTAIEGARAASALAGERALARGIVQLVPGDGKRGSFDVPTFEIIRCDPSPSEAGTGASNRDEYPTDLLGALEASLEWLQSHPLAGLYAADRAARAAARKRGTP